MPRRAAKAGACVVARGTGTKSSSEATAAPPAPVLAEEGASEGGMMSSVVQSAKNGVGKIATAAGQASDRIIDKVEVVVGTTDTVQAGAQGAVKAVQGAAQSVQGAAQSVQGATQSVQGAAAQAPVFRSGFRR